MRMIKFMFMFTFTFMMMAACSQQSPDSIPAVGGASAKQKPAEQKSKESPVPTLEASRCVKYSEPILGDFPPTVPNSQDSFLVAFVVENTCDHAIGGELLVMAYDSGNRIAGTIRMPFRKFLPKQRYEAAIPMDYITYAHRMPVVRATVRSFDHIAFSR